MEKTKKKPDLVVWSEERGYYPRELTYGSNLGAPSINIDDVEGWKHSQVSKANSQFKTRFDEIKSEFERLTEEVKWNDIVYSSQYNFIPVIGDTYHLYSRDEGSLFLSLITPSSWNESYIGSFKLTSDQRWIKIEYQR